MTDDKNLTQEPIKDFKLSIGSPSELSEETLKARSKMMAKGLSYEGKGTYIPSRSSDGSFVSPIYDLAEISRCADVEPYVAQSIRRHREQILKEGYEPEGEDDTMVDYIKQRLFEIALISGIPTSNWIRETITNLVTYHNAGLVFRRDSTRSSGSMIEMYGKILSPIAGIYPVDPTTMSVKVDKYGTPKQWKQKVSADSGYEASDTEKTFPPEDVLWITLDKKTGFTFGTPYILPVLEDIRALRKLEELAMIIASKEAFPLYHYKVGTEQNPAGIYEGGANEVDVVKSEVANMPTGGAVITSERHEINLISRAGSALDLHPYLEYFEARVLAGLRLSPMDLGRGGSANRACYSSDTQTLTDKGWKFYWDIDIKKDKIATIDQVSGELKFEFANDLYTYRYKGKMYHFINDSIDCLVTPDHDMWVKKDAAFMKIKAEELAKLDVLSLAEYSFTNQVEWTGDSKIDPDLITFYAYFIKYGKINNRRKEEIKFIVRDEDVAHTIETFISSLDLDYRAYDNEGYTKIVIYDLELASKLARDLATNEYPKRLPKWIMDLNKEGIKLFYHRLTEFDSISKDIKVFRDRSKVITSQMQELLLKIGIASKATETGLYFLENGEIPIIFDIIDYDSDVYCYNVPNHVFITRRNGIIAIQGNTASNINQNVQDAAKDYQEVFSDAITFGLFIPLLLEGGFDVTMENVVEMCFPMINREELRAHQNHGQQLMLGNAITDEEFRKDYLKKKPLSDEERSKLTRQLDTEATMQVAEHAASVAPTPTPDAPGGPEVTKTVTSKRGTPENNTTTKKVIKMAGNKGQPANQFGKKPAKSRFKANDYESAVKNNLDILLDNLAQLSTSDLDDLEYEDIQAVLDKNFDTFITMNVQEAAKYLPIEIDIGASAASGASSTIGNRAKDKFLTNYVKKSYLKFLAPVVDRIGKYFQRDEDGNMAPFNGLEEVINLSNSINFLTTEHKEVAKRFGFGKTARNLGYDSIILENIESKDRKTIDLPIKGPIPYQNLIVDDKKYDLLHLGNKTGSVKESDE